MKPRVNVPALERARLTFEVERHPLRAARPGAAELPAAFDLSELMVLYRLEGALTLDARMA